MYVKGIYYFPKNQRVTNEKIIGLVKAENAVFRVPEKWTHSRVLQKILDTYVVFLTEEGFEKIVRVSKPGFYEVFE